MNERPWIDKTKSVKQKQRTHFFLWSAWISSLLSKRTAGMEKASRLYHPQGPLLNFQTLAQSADLLVVHNLRSLNVAF